MACIETSFIGMAKSFQCAVRNNSIQGLSKFNFNQQACHMTESMYIQVDITDRADSVFK